MPKNFNYELGFAKAIKVVGNFENKDICKFLDPEIADDLLQYPFLLVNLPLVNSFKIHKKVLDYYSVFYPNFGVYTCISDLFLAYYMLHKHNMLWDQAKEDWIKKEDCIQEEEEINDANS